jgi:hypothetical protein
MASVHFIDRRIRKPKAQSRQCQGFFGAMAILFGTWLQKLPLPLGEGWGEGAGNLCTVRSTLTRPAAGLSQRERRDGEAPAHANKIRAEHYRSMALASCSGE